MGLKKTIAAYAKIVNGDRILVPQQEVDMHPLEEAEIIAWWAVGDSLSTKPLDITDSQKLDWLIKNGSSYVQDQIDLWQKTYDLWEANHSVVVSNHETARKAYEIYMDSIKSNS